VKAVTQAKIRDLGGKKLEDSEKKVLRREDGGERQVLERRQNKWRSEVT